MKQARRILGLFCRTGSRDVLNFPKHLFYKVILISTLYISQSVPVAFIKTGFQLFLKENDLEYGTISMLLGLMLLPWAIKFLWAPLVDRFTLYGNSHRKSWIIPLQITGALILIITAFMEPAGQLLQICILLLAYSFICSTQDIAVDGLAVLMLNKKEHGAGNSMQMGGYYLGELLGGAVILIMLGNYGWTASMLFLAGLFVLPLLPLLALNERQEYIEKKERPGFRSIRDWFIENEKMWVLLLVLYTGNQVLARTLLPGLLTDLNYSYEQIGKITGIWGNGASLVGAVLGGLLINSIGRRNSILYYGILKLLAFFPLFLLLNEDISRTSVLLIIMLNEFAAGLATVALFTVMMDKCSLDRPGTDFTIQQSINAIGILFFVVISGIIVDQAGFKYLFAGAIFLAALSIIIAVYGVKWRSVEVNANDASL